MTEEPEEFNNIVEGKNPVAEVLRSGRQIDKIWVALPESGRYDQLTYMIIKDAKAAGAVIIETTRKVLDKMSITHGHQGIIARVAAHEYVSIDEMIRASEEKNVVPMILILDGLKDPYNLGSILRLADAAGVNGVIIPKHRSVGLDAAAAKASAGAIEHVPVAKVTNISSTIDDLKSRGFWIYATHQDAEKNYYDIDYSGPAAIIVGSEGEGISAQLIKKSDFVVRIPMKGSVNSLNAAVAAGIIVFEAIRSRETSVK